ncbi:MAG: helix-turn-helix domain-containing protein [Deltaproteobacteria bacterium]|nr:helix-turn-helix domain-containing protein [Deltaproteobacteria bacterium]
MSEQPTTAVLGSRLRQRREELGATLEQAAQWSGLVPEWLAAMEAGALDVTAGDFERACRGIAVDPTVIYRGDDTPKWRMTRFRAASTPDAPLPPAAIRALALGAELGRVLASLLRRLGRPVPLEQHRRTEALRSAPEPWEQGYVLGERARARLFPDPGPIQDVEALLADLGVHVGPVRFGVREIEAASLWEPGAAPVILLNAGLRRARYGLSRRAILCHELCHLLHDAGEAQMTTRVSWSEDAGNYDDAIEQRARGFSPAFLAPREQVRSALAEELGAKRRPDAPRVVGAIARRWGLSYEGAIWHARNCRLIHVADAQHLVARHSASPQLPWAHELEQPLPTAAPALVHAALPDRRSPIMDGAGASVVLAALDRAVISAGRAREILTWA